MLLKSKTTLEILTENLRDEYIKYKKLSREEELLQALNDVQRIDRELAKGNLSVYNNLEEKYGSLMSGQVA